MIAAISIAFWVIAGGYALFVIGWTIRGARR